MPNFKAMALQRGTYVPRGLNVITAIFKNHFEDFKWQEMNHAARHAPNGWKDAHQEPGTEEKNEEVSCDVAQTSFLVQILE